MLLGINLPIYSAFLPALAGIHVMLQIMPQFSYQVDKACISRYSYNVTIIDFFAYYVRSACISRYSCNVTERGTIKPCVRRRLH